MVLDKLKSRPKRDMALKDARKRIVNAATMVAVQ